MIDKYFGFKTLTNEQSIIDSLIEHSKIDEEEFTILKEMLDNITEFSLDDIELEHQKIVQIRQNSNANFAYTEEQIIQAQFDQQKQHDLLLIYQRIEDISSSILSCADHILLLFRTHGKFPEQCLERTKKLISMVHDNHLAFIQILSDYEENKSGIIKTIHSIIEDEQLVNDQYFRCIETLYLIANENTIPFGHLRAIEKILLHVEILGNKIESATTSFEMLLIK